MSWNYVRRGSGPPLLLLHGIGSRWQMWEPVLAQLTAQREVIALDLPGFGASPMPPPGTPAGVPSLTRLVAEFLDELGVQRPHVAGNSLGGMVALELAKAGRVSSVTALSPAGFHSRGELIYQRAALWTLARVARALEPWADQLNRSPIGRTLSYSLVVARPRQISAADGAASARALAGAPWFDATLKAFSAPFAGGEQIDVPVTIAWGAKDRLLRPRQAARAQREIPRARVLKLTRCGHVPTYDDPGEVARVLLEGSAQERSDGSAHERSERSAQERSEQSAS
jgi:pimeloyl-ACP methyl ester carboxylesterase